MRPLSELAQFGAVAVDDIHLVALALLAPPTEQDFLPIERHVAIENLPFR